MSSLKSQAYSMSKKGMTPTEIGRELGVSRSKVWHWLNGDKGGAKKLKVLLYDIETAPSLAYIWRPTDDYVQPERLIHDSFLLCWSAKWLDKGDVVGDVLTPSEAVGQDDVRVVQSLADLIRQADIVVAHNGDGFDYPMLNTRLLSLGLDPIGPVRFIDTLSLAKKNFRLSYNSLDYIASFLGLGQKIKTSFDLWKKCYHGNQEAIGKMFEYNKRDVVLLEKVFNAMIPYVKGLPRMVEATSPDQMACPYCGSENLKESGTYRTNISSFQRYVCQDCGRYTRSRSCEPDRLATATV